MSFLLDTCVLSELTRRKPHPNVIRWFEAQDSAALFVSVLTIGEIEKGMATLPTGRKKVALSGWLAVVDGLIAATALHHGYTVVTRTVGDFLKTVVALINAWQA